MACHTLIHLLFCAYMVGYVLCACSEGYYQHGTSCYHFSADAETWVNAMAFCEILGGKLAKVETLQEAQFLQQTKLSIQNTTGFDIWYWIGLNDELENGVWRWLDGSLVTVNFWSPGEPNSFQGNPENCGIVGTTGRWYDVPCNMAQPHYICEKGLSGPVIG